MYVFCEMYQMHKLFIIISTKIIVLLAAPALTHLFLLLKGISAAVSAIAKPALSFCHAAVLYSSIMNCHLHEDDFFYHFITLRRTWSFIFCKGGLSYYFQSPYLEDRKFLFFGTPGQNGKSNGVCHFFLGNRNK